MSEPADPRKLRPWYVVATMVILWIVGAMVAMRGCSEVGYLRGDLAFRKSMDGRLASLEAPAMRAAMLRERAWLDATAIHYRRAFPLALAKLFLAGLLVVAAGSVLAGRRGSRGLATQVLVANAALVALAFALMSPARRDAVSGAARAAAEDQAAAEVLLGQSVAEMEEAPLVEGLAREYAALELRTAAFELSLYLVALLAMTRRRARLYFAALDQPVADPEGS